MVKTTELVSIIVPCYNQAQYLEESVQSCIDQTYSNIEIIIINDGSTDNTEEVALLLQEKYPKKIQVILQENTGLSVARNNAIRQSTGTYILPLDSDDLIEKNMVDSCLKHMIDKNADIVYVHQQCFGVKNHLIKRSPFPRNNLLYQNIACSTSLYKREVWEKTGGYARNMEGGYEDWEFWIHAFKKGYKFQLLPEPLHLYRRHEISMVTKAIDKDIYLGSKIVINHSELYPIEHVKKSIQVISDSESLANLYFYYPVDFLLDQKYLIEAISQYMTSKKLQKNQFIDIPDNNKKIILYTLDIIKDHKHLQQLCVNEEGNFVIFYSSLRYEIPTLKNLNFAWDNDKGIIETKGSIFPFVFKSIREDKKLQLIAYQRFYKYNTEVLEPKTRQQASICKQRIENREKTIQNREKTIQNKDKMIQNKDKMIQNRNKMIQNRENLTNKQNKTIKEKKNLISKQNATLHKVNKAKENVVRIQAIFHPIKKYKAYKNLIKQINKI